ncbi:site-specific integrase, partial [bacterium]|nr:site-specific integrase [bacterium]
LRKLEEEQARIALGLEPVEKIEPIMLSQFIQVYQEDRRRIGKSQETIGIDEFALTLLQKYLSDCKISTINDATALRYRNYLLESVKPATASIRLRAIRTAFGWACEKPGVKYLKSNPFKQKGLIPSDNTQRAPLCLTQDEKIRFLNVISEDPEHEKVFRFMLLSGVRRAEVIGLDWSDIDLESKVINIQQTKTHKVRKIPITIELWQLLSSIERSKPKPFEYSPDWLSALFRRYAGKAGLRPELHLHSLRHTVATDLVNQGVPIHQVKDFMGHSKITTTQIYLHSVDDDLRRVAERLTCLG